MTRSDGNGEEGTTTPPGGTGGGGGGGGAGAGGGGAGRGVGAGDLPENPLADLRLRRPPFWMVALFLVLIVLSWIPLVVAARRRVSTSEDPAIHIVQDMDNQPKYKAQQQNPLFADTRADRPTVAGTVAVDGLRNDDHYFRGYAVRGGKPEFFAEFPRQVKVDEPLLRRGMQKYNIYCSACHGYDGTGQGPVNQRAVELQDPKWVQAANLHSDQVKQRANGHLYNTITNGIRNMAGYGSQVPVADRWAIVAYLRALQLSQDAPANAVPAEKLSAMK